MALKTNSKKAMENLYNYIRDYAEDYLVTDYNITPAEISTKTGLYKAIYNIFKAEKNPAGEYYRRTPEGKVFEEWASGLALGGLFCFWYNRSAAKDLAGILEQTEAESSKYSQEASQELLTNLIYREVSRA